MNYEQMNNNKVFLKGEVMTEHKYSHETFGEAFYELSIGVERLSGTKDILPITVSEKFISNGKFDVGKTICIKGQFRSYNKLEKDKSKLMLTVFVREVLDNDTDINSNIIEITGYICKPPVYRTTPFNREICDVLLAVNRSYNKSDYLPCIAWGRNARFIKDAGVGQKVNIVGRIQSREYQKTAEDGSAQNKTAYEISITRVSRDSDELLKAENE